MRLGHVVVALLLCVNCGYSKFMGNFSLLVIICGPKFRDIHTHTHTHSLAQLTTADVRNVNKN